jgi:hypothetical protein
MVHSDIPEFTDPIRRDADASAILQAFAISQQIEPSCLRLLFHSPTSIAIGLRQASSIDRDVASATQQDEPAAAPVERYYWLSTNSQHQDERRTRFEQFLQVALGEAAVEKNPATRPSVTTVKESEDRIWLVVNLPENAFLLSDLLSAFDRPPPTIINDWHGQTLAAIGLWSQAANTPSSEVDYDNGPRVSQAIILADGTLIPTWMLDSSLFLPREDSTIESDANIGAQPEQQANRSLFDFLKISPEELPNSTTFHSQASHSQASAETNARSPLSNLAALDLSATKDKLSAGPRTRSGRASKTNARTKLSTKSLVLAGMIAVGVVVAGTWFAMNAIETNESSDAMKIAQDSTKGTPQRSTESSTPIDSNRGDRKAMQRSLDRQADKSNAAGSDVAGSDAAGNDVAGNDATGNAEIDISEMDLVETGGSMSEADAQAILSQSNDLSIDNMLADSRLLSRSPLSLGTEDTSSSGHGSPEESTSTQAERIVDGVDSSSSEISSVDSMDGAVQSVAATIEDVLRKSKDDEDLRTIEVSAEDNSATSDAAERTAYVVEKLVITKALTRATFKLPERPKKNSAAVQIDWELPESMSVEPDGPTVLIGDGQQIFRLSKEIEDSDRLRRQPCELLIRVQSEPGVKWDFRIDVLLVFSTTNQRFPIAQDQASFLLNRLGQISTFLQQRIIQIDNVADNAPSKDLRSAAQQTLRPLRKQANAADDAIDAWTNASDLCDDFFGQERLRLSIAPTLDKLPPPAINSPTESSMDGDLNRPNDDADN